MCRPRTEGGANLDSGPYSPPNAEIAEPTGSSLVPTYTVVLGATGALMLFGALSLFSFAGRPDVEDAARWTYELSAQVGVLLAAIAGLVVFLRVRESQFAPSATAIFSTFLIIYFPLGTSVFIYWLASVRKREREWRAI